MKNIFVLPTYKPSRLAKHSSGSFHIVANKAHKKGLYKMTNQHIYITSDEEIKEWYIYEGRLLRASVNHSKYELLYGKPIILTTDPDLIKDGVQAIDDEFLEWFVKNPSCEFVEVMLQYQYHTSKEFYIDADYIDCSKEQYDSIKNEIPTCPLRVLYKIIIPQEEPNKLNLKELENKLDDSLANETKESLTSWLSSKRNEQETIEEAVKKITTFYKGSAYRGFIDGFSKGAKWQSERMYSEEDMKQFGLYLGDNFKKLKGKTIDDIFEQFKKK